MSQNIIQADVVFESMGNNRRRETKTEREGGDRARGKEGRRDKEGEGRRGKKEKAEMNNLN